MPKLFIKLGEVPRNVFVDDCVIIPVFLVDSSDKLHPPIDAYNHLIVRCRVEGATHDSESVPEFVVEQGSNRINTNGTGQLRLTFKSVSMNFENRKFVIHVSKQSPRDVVSAQTPPLFVISQQLVLTEEFSDTYTWYKDEGGKDKCIEYGVHMIDRLGNRVRGKKVTLKVTLMYKTGQQVPQQNILTMLPDSKMVLDERTGSTTLRVRINEVSTRHQGQLFQVLVSPDIAVSPATADVCSVLSVPIDVKSKRNHHKERDRERCGESIHQSVSSTRLASAALNDSHSNKRLRQTSDDSVTSSVPATPHVHNTRSSQQQSSPRLHDADDAHALLGLGHHHHHHHIGTGAFNLTDQPCEHDGVLSDKCFCKGDDPHLRFSKATDFNSSVGNLVLWAKTVMKGMERIQWTQIGYHTAVDGSPDPARPLFNIANPHETIANIVQEYSTYIQPSLHYLGTMTTDPHSVGVGDAGCDSADADIHQLDDKILGMMNSIDMWNQESGCTIDDIAMPSLIRGMSFKSMNMMSLDPVSLARNHSLYLDLPGSSSSNSSSKAPITFAADPISFTPHDAALDTSDGIVAVDAITAAVESAETQLLLQKQLEESVEHILVYPCKHKEYSVSCFDAEQKLIGFYKDTSSCVSLLCTQDMIASSSVNKANIGDLEQSYHNMLVRALSGSSDEGERRWCLFSKDKFMTSKAEGNSDSNVVSKMKEDALLQLIVMGDPESGCSLCPHCFV